jgi:uncharacterized protein YggE
MSRVVPALSVSVVALAFAAAAAPSQAQQPAPTLTASGIGEVKPEPENRKSDASIRKAVEEANAQALPKAMDSARAHAADLATAAGMTLGPLIAISDTQNNGYPYYFVQNGTFGNGRFCGQVRNTRTVVRNGVRRRVAGKGTRRVCRVPPRIYASVSLTFSVTPVS